MAASPWLIWLLALSGLASVLGFITVLCPYLLGVRSYCEGWPLTAGMAFVALFLFCNWRRWVHIEAHSHYKPSPMAEKPTFDPGRDVTVIIPTVEPGDPTFHRCLSAICANTPARVFVVTVGVAFCQVAEDAMKAVRKDHPHVAIQVHNHPVANKRAQIDSVIDFINTPITFLVDATAIWPSRFLPQALAPFEDPGKGLVGTRKLVERLESGTFWEHCWNRKGAFYLERHNYEMEASDTLDGGVFIISGRTCGLRSDILRNQDFRRGYLDEHISFSPPFLPGVMDIGPIVADDDNYILRWCVDHDIGVKFQSNVNSAGTGIDDNCVVRIANLGKYPRYVDQCLRWARTTFRSNPRTLLSRNAWRKHPWSMYGVQLATLTNFAAINDPLQVYLYWQMGLEAKSRYWAWGLGFLVFWILFSKVIKLVPWLRRYPNDIVYLPAQIAFAYRHSVIKMHAMLTFWNVEWAGRDLNKINSLAQKGELK
ncbi:hypothetical protein PG985_003870 [Apiospora marii]|uniref:Glycosyltransferase family 2 protein n=1 Tax=Apiospora marii TaxID=335849 RepID=A0ABR1SII9_9PEZI